MVRAYQLLCWMLWPTAFAYFTEDTVPTVPTHSACILIPVHEPHFPQLGALLSLTLEFLVDKPPIYVVFDTPADTQSFCKRSPHLCTVSHFFALSLQQLLGHGMYQTIRRIIFEGERPFPTWFFNAGNSSRNSCEPQTPGRIYQSLKKFYGARELAGSCSLVLVADAESFPYRRSNFTKQMEVNVRRPRMWVPIWAGNWDGCTFKRMWPYWTPCRVLVAEQLNIRSSWQPGGPPAKLDSRQQRFAYYSQIHQLYDEAIWIWSPTFLSRSISFSEKQTGLPFPVWWSSLQMFETIFVEVMSLYLASLGELEILSLPVELQKRFPKSYHDCCSCNGPDYDTRVFYMDEKHHVRPETMPCTLVLHSIQCLGEREGARLTRWYTDELGVFITSRGLFRSMVPWTFVEDTFSWCINNCMEPPAFTRFLQQSSTAAVLRQHVAPVTFKNAACLGIAATGPDFKPLERLLLLADELLVDQPPIYVMFNTRREMEDFCASPTKPCARAQTLSIDYEGMEFHRYPEEPDVLEVFFKASGQAILAPYMKEGACMLSEHSIMRSVLTVSLLWDLQNGTCDWLQMLDQDTIPVRRTNFTAMLRQSSWHETTPAGWHRDLGGCMDAPKLAPHVEPPRVYRTSVMPSMATVASRRTGWRFPAPFIALRATDEDFFEVLGEWFLKSHSSFPWDMDQQPETKDESRLARLMTAYGHALATDALSLSDPFAWCRDCLSGEVWKALQKRPNLETETIRRVLEMVGF